MVSRPELHPECWHLLSPGAAAGRLRSSLPDGLTPADAAERLARDGPNLILPGRPQAPLFILLRQFSDVMVLVLLAAAVLAGIIGEPQDTVAIVAILLLNALLGFLQEYRAERAVAALRAISASPVRVRRGGEVSLIQPEGLVPGDIVLLETGNVVPADLRLTEVNQLRLDESALTGESLPVDKSRDELTEEALPLAERRNLAYRGTAVTHGRGEGLVVATGMHTELGRIAQLLADEPQPSTPLQQRLASLGRRLAAGALAVCVLVLVLGLIRHEPPLPMLLTAISLAVAAIPESLPAVVTVALAIGARRMAREKALVRRLPAVETLGSVTRICADKTGTLTRNRMQMESGWVPGAASTSAREIPRSEQWRRLFQAVTVCSDVHVAAAGPLGGEPTELALVEAAATWGIDPRELRARLPRVAEVPFTPERSRMTTVHQDRKALVAYTKGSPERVLPGCVGALGPSGPVELDREGVVEAADRMAAAGLRVLAVAERRLVDLEGDPLTSVESGQTLLGLVGLWDPPRPEAAAAVAACRSAGIAVVMITGDHPVTAGSIARRLGILDPGGGILTGMEVAALTEEQLVELAATVQVFARVAPEQKIAIIRALQARGECVAMTGDGVNDAPALRRADVGVAMGRSGTDVAREAAPLVLLDDNFATIVTAIRAGRRIYDNLRRFVRYAVTCNAAEVGTLLLAPLIGLPVPLLPIHLLWINLVTDGLPGVALAAEPAEPQVMRRPPRRVDESIFAGGLWQHVVWVGFLMAAVTLAAAAWSYHAGGHWRSMTFTVLALSQMGHVLAIRSDRESLWRLGVTTNPSLLAAVLLTVVLQLGAVFTPLGRAVLRTDRLSAGELVLALLLSSVVFLAVELEKWLIRHGRLYRCPAGGAVQSPTGPGNPDRLDRVPPLPLDAR